MLLVIQFRTDESGPHEIKAIHDVSGLKYNDICALNVLTPWVDTDDLLHFASKAHGVIIGGWVENGLEANTKHKKQQLDKVLRILRPVLEFIHTTDKPTLGICFGHQVIAEMFGGKVERVLEQAEIGVADIILNEDGREDRIFDGMGDTFSAVQGHKSSVTKLPEGAVHLAYNESSAYQSYKMKNNIYCVQFHPELTGTLLQDRLNLFPDYADNHNSYEFDKEVTSQSVLENFIKHVVEPSK